VSKLAYARKYRPKDFDEIVDQEHIATTLKNAITQNNIAHAYIFSGPRGIGKTSTARILAKALNCKKGPTEKPCNKCTVCLEITEGRSMDVLEIDGASNRGIDEIRALRENVKFAPTSSRFKIYIIDEVHMLTTEAFNALLKTLEEPPSHVKFIFATTEPHKVLPTILSRCQRFDFRKITTQGIINKLKSLVKEEKIKCDEEALFTIARNADGSLRDAEVILDQMNSFSKGKITQDAVNSVLGLVSREAIFSMAQDLNAENISKNLSLLNSLIQEGKEPAQLVGSFIEHFRDMMLIKCNCPDLVSASKEDKQKIKEQSEKFGIENILYCIAVLSQTQEKIKRQGMSRLLLEMAIVKLSEQDGIISTNVLISKIKALEEKIRKMPAGVFAASPANKPQPPVSGGSAASGSGPFAKKVPEVKPSKPISGSPPVPEKAQGAFSEPEGNVAVVVETGDINRLWPQIIKEVRKKKISLGIYLAEGRLLSTRNNILEVGFLDEYEFHRENLLESGNLKFIEEMASIVLDKKIRFDLVNCKELPQEKEAEEPLKVQDGFTEQVEESSAEEEEDFDSFIQSANGRKP